MSSSLIDLTFPLSGKTPYYPGDVPPQVKQVSDVEHDGVAGSVLTLSTHHGTHIDAPSHFVKGGKTLSDFPIERFAALPGVLIDARDISLINESILEGVRLSPGCAVLFWTGYTNSHKSKFEIQGAPALTPSLAKALVKAKVGMVGIDSFSVDFGDFTVHKTLLAADILINETLTNFTPLAKAVNSGKSFLHHALPLNLQYADGSPCRSFAQII